MLADHVYHYSSHHHISLLLLILFLTFPGHPTLLLRQYMLGMVVGDEGNKSQDDVPLKNLQKIENMLKGGLQYLDEQVQ